MKNNTRLKAFLLYDSVDISYVHKLYINLVNDGFDAWFDQEKVLPGQNTQIENEKAISDADVVIVCLSPNSINKEGYIQKAIKYAKEESLEKLEDSIFLIPVLFGECDIPRSLNRFESVNMLNPSGYERLKRSLFLKKSFSKSPIVGDASGRVLRETKIKILLMGSFSDIALMKSQIKQDIEYLVDDKLFVTNKVGWAVDVVTTSQFKNISKTLASETVIIHFSGIIDQDNLNFEDETGIVQSLPINDLLRTIQLFKNRVQCIFLNVNNSGDKSHLLSKYAEYAVGIQGKMDPKTSLFLASGFYKALIKGKSYEEAIMSARINLPKVSLKNSDFLLPVMYKNGARMTPDKTEVANMAQRILNKIQAAKVKKLNFLLVGKAGVGKSSAINSLLGKEVAETNGFESSTKVIKPYENEYQGIKVSVIDTPGLCDGDGEATDKESLSLIKNSVAEVDCLLFVTNLSETRVLSDEKNGIKLITQSFGEKIWENAVIIFTFADRISPSKFADTLKKRAELITGEIIKSFSPENKIKEIPYVAIDNTSKFTPDGKDWIGNLYFTVLNQISDNVGLPFLLATQNRKQKIPLTEEAKENIFTKIKTFFNENEWATLAAIFGTVVIAGIFLEEIDEN